MAPKAGKTKPHKSKGEKKKKEEKGSHYNHTIHFGSSTQNDKVNFCFVWLFFFKQKIIENCVVVQFCPLSLR